MINKLYEDFIKIFIISSAPKLNIKDIHDVKNKMLIHQSKMPDYMSFPLKFISVILLLIINILNAFGVKSEYIFNIFRDASIKSIRNIIRLHDSIFLVIDKTPIEKSPIVFSINTLQSSYEYLIVGSGPGGSIIGEKLIENGKDVCMLESGNFQKNKINTSFTYNEMINKYKHGGISATIGNCNIAYVEGCTFGGGSYS